MLERHKSTDRLRRVFGLARKRASELQHDTIQAVHVLLGFTDEGEGVGCNVLKNLGVSIDDVRKTVLAQLKDIPKTSYPIENLGAPIEEAPFADDSLALWDAIVQVSHSMNHSHFGTDHILVAFFDVPATQALLEGFRVSRQQVYDETLLLLGSGADSSSPDSEPETPTDRIQIAIALPEFVDASLVEDSLVQLYAALDDMHRAAGGSGLQVDEGQAFLGTEVLSEVPS